MAEVTVETIVAGGLIVLRVTAPDGAGVELEMTADDARQFCNDLGGAIKCVSRTGVRT